MVPGKTYLPMTNTNRKAINYETLEKLTTVVKPNIFIIDGVASLSKKKKKNTRRINFSNFPLTMNETRNCRLECKERLKKIIDQTIISVGIFFTVISKFLFYNLKNT